MNDQTARDALQDQRNTLLKLCAGNGDAARLIEEAWRFAAVYDDAIDGDKRGSETEIHNSFAWALWGLQRNRFYQQHRTTIDTVMQVAVEQWKTANAFERSGERDKLAVAYVLRCSPYTLFAAVVLLANGPEAVADAMVYFHSVRGSTDTLDAYLAEHTI